jgi:hypothetical protein
LDAVCQQPRITVEDLTAAGVLPVPATAGKPLRAESDSGEGLFDL